MKTKFFIYRIDGRQDVSKRDQWTEVFRHCEDFFKGHPLELLVNNAGLSGAGGVDYETVVDINLKGVMHGTMAFIEKYGKSKVRTRLCDVKKI